jgi:hypothetical protein
VPQKATAWASPRSTRADIRRAPLGPQHALGLTDERRRDSSAPDLGRDGEPLDVAAPAFEAADDTADDSPGAERNQEAGAVLAPDGRASSSGVSVGLGIAPARVQSASTAPRARRDGSAGS